MLRKTPERLVFIDETSVKTKLTRARGRARKDKRQHAHAPAGLRNTQTFIAGLTQDGQIAPCVIKGAMDRAAFDTSIETQLTLALEPGTVVILDNLATHKSAKAAEILKAMRCWLLFLPPCSPDLNPIEMAFSKLKAHLKRIGDGTFDTLLKAIGNICNLFPPDACSNYFSHAGYIST